MKPIAVTTEIIVARSRQKAFDVIVPIDLSLIFTGHFGLPAVTGTKDETGEWTSAGQSRTVCLSDGSEVSENLDTYVYPETFNYTVSGVSGILGLLAKFAKGQWWFEPKDETGTRVTWQYAFTPTSVFAWPLLWLIANLLWAGYMRKAIIACKHHVEIAR